MIFGRTPRPEPTRSQGSARLDALVRAHMPAADDDERRIVVALAGLCASIAYADRRYEDAEHAYVRDSLARVQGLAGAGAEAICEALREHVVELAAGNTHAYLRDLREGAEPEVRREVLEALVDLAAADGELSLAETNLLRRTARSLGLDDDDYLAAQTRHRERLSVLK